jgi:hypothetical protein
MKGNKLVEGEEEEAEEDEEDDDLIFDAGAERIIYLFSRIGFEIATPAINNRAANNTTSQA